MSDAARTPPERVVRAMISGRVQGVGFRAFTKAEGQALGLRGFVRNRSGGDVEAVFGGPAAAVARLCERLKRGPPSARVAKVELSEVGESELAQIGDCGFHEIVTL